MTPTVLLVDDELAVLQALVRRLRKEPYKIWTATSAEEALGIFARMPVDLIVSDWGMRGMSGNELLARIARDYPQCIRIMLTGKADVTVAMGAVNNGRVHKFLTKPCDGDTLAATIRDAFSAWPLQ
jgi:DNA-binding NtrC family response regulator